MSRRILPLFLTIALMLTITPLGSAVGAVEPTVAATTVITFDPATNDGNVGWYLSAPSVSFTTEQDGTVYYAWNGGIESTVSVTAGIPSFVDPAPEGVGMLSAYSVNSLNETETPSVTGLTLVDSIPPTRPMSLTLEVAGSGAPVLMWDVSADAGSGLDYYTVYRNLSGPPFQPSDAIGTSATESFTDADAPPVPVYYAVAAWDQAGHQSLLSDAVSVSADRDVPTTPGDLVAWLNAQSWVRVSWTASTDIGSGLSGYEVSRRLDAGSWSIVATLPPSSTYYDDRDPAVASAGTIEYRVLAFDRAGLQSEPAGPVVAGVDTTPPDAPSGPVVVPVHTGEVSGSFVVSWQIPADALSGIMSGEMLSGTSDDALVVTTGIEDSSIIVEVDEGHSLRYFAVRFEDRAGNLSELSPVAAGRNVAVVRAAGATRIETSHALSDEAFDAASTVVFASAADYPDALAASGLAGSVDGPVLLVGSGALPAGTIAELERLGATDGYVIGGPMAVSAETMTSIGSALSGTVTRLSGQSRYETAVAVAQEIVRISGTPTRAYIVSARGFADALSVGPAAFAETVPVLFANDATVPGVTLSALDDLGITETIITGGPMAITPQAESLLPDPLRLSGATRYETSAAFVEWAYQEGVLYPDRPVIATGATFPDGLCAASAAGHFVSAVHLVSDSTAEALVARLANDRASFEYCTVAGGPLAIPDATIALIFDSISTP